MVAAILLVLVLTDAHGTRAMVQPLPTMQACEAAKAACLAPELRPEGFVTDHPSQDRAVQRSGLCITVPVFGRDA